MISFDPPLSYIFINAFKTQKLCSSHHSFLNKHKNNISHKFQVLIKLWLKGHAEGSRLKESSRRFLHLCLESRGYNNKRFFCYLWSAEIKSHCTFTKQSERPCLCVIFCFRQAVCKWIFIWNSLGQIRLTIQSALQATLTHMFIHIILFYTL